MVKFNSHCFIERKSERQSSKEKSMHFKLNIFDIQCKEGIQEIQIQKIKEKYRELEMILSL